MGLDEGRPDTSHGRGARPEPRRGPGALLAGGGVVAYAVRLAVAAVVAYVCVVWISETMGDYFRVNPYQFERGEGAAGLLAICVLSFALSTGLVWGIVSGARLGLSSALATAATFAVLWLVPGLLAAAAVLGGGIPGGFAAGLCAGAGRQSTRGPRASLTPGRAFLPAIVASLVGTIGFIAGFLGPPQRSVGGGMGHALTFLIGLGAALGAGLAAEIGMLVARRRQARGRPGSAPAAQALVAREDVGSRPVSFALQYGGATMVAYAAALLVLPLLSLGATGPGLVSLMAFALRGSVVGALLGIAQGLVLRRSSAAAGVWLPPRAQWFGVTLAGWLFESLVRSWIHDSTAMLMFTFMGLFRPVADAVIAGAVVGGGQWLLLRRHTRDAAWWIAVTWAAMVLHRILDSLPWSLFGTGTPGSLASIARTALLFGLTYGLGQGLLLRALTRRRTMPDDRQSESAALVVAPLPPERPPLPLPGVTIGPAPSRALRLPAFGIASPLRSSRTRLRVALAVAGFFVVTAATFPWSLYPTEPGEVARRFLNPPDLDLISPRAINTRAALAVSPWLTLSPWPVMMRPCAKTAECGLFRLASGPALFLVLSALLWVLLVARRSGRRGNQVAAASLLVLAWAPYAWYGWSSVREMHVAPAERLNRIWVRLHAISRQRPLPDGTTLADPERAWAWSTEDRAPFLPKRDPIFRLGYRGDGVTLAFYPSPRTISFTAQQRYCREGQFSEMTDPEPVTFRETADHVWSCMRSGAPTREFGFLDGPLRTIWASRRGSGDPARPSPFFAYYRPDGTPRAPLAFEAPPATLAPGRAAFWGKWIGKWTPHVSLVLVVWRLSEDGRAWVRYMHDGPWRLLDGVARFEDQTLVLEALVVAIDPSRPGAATVTNRAMRTRADLRQVPVRAGDPADVFTARELPGETPQLRSGSYRADAAGYAATWTLTVSGSSITGESVWSCCPGPRRDPLKGSIEGAEITLRRDCAGQGIQGECEQVFTGTIEEAGASGTFTMSGKLVGSWTIVRQP